MWDRRSIPPAPSAMSGRRYLQQRPIPPACGDVRRQHGSRELQSQPDQSVHRASVRPAAGRRSGALDQELLSKRHAARHLRAAFRTRLAAVRQRPPRGPRRLRLVLSDAHLQRQRVRNAAVHLRAFCPGLQQFGLQQQSLAAAKSVPRDDSRLRPAHADLAAFRSRGRPELLIPAAPAMEPERANATLRGRSRWTLVTWAPTAIIC